MMVVAAMQGADQHQEQFEVQYLAQGLRHADQENRTSNLITRRWLYRWATATPIL